MNPELWELAWTISRLNRVEIRIYANVNHLTANVDGMHLNQESIMKPRSLGIEDRRRKRLRLFLVGLQLQLHRRC
jgi:hypothetical protein